MVGIFDKKVLHQKEDTLLRGREGRKAENSEKQTLQSVPRSESITLPSSWW